MILAAVLAAIWAATEWAGGSTSPDVLVRLGARPASWGFGVDPWTLIGSILLHYGLLHLLFNLVGLLALGTVLESLMGAGWIWLLFFAAGISGSSLSLEMTPRVASVGASGAVFGMAACLLVLLIRIPSRFEPPFRKSGIPLLALSLAFGMAGDVSGFALDRYGHLGGALGGLLFGLTLGERPGGLKPHPLGLAVLTALLAASAAYVLRGPRLFL